MSHSLLTQWQSSPLLTGKFQVRVLGGELKTPRFYSFPWGSCYIQTHFRWVPAGIRLVAMTLTADNTVTVYTQPGCGPCIGLTRRLDALGIDYDLRDIRVDESAADRVRELGYTGTPVVEHPGGHFKGFDTEKVQELTVALFAV